MGFEQGKHKTEEIPTELTKILVTAGMTQTSTTKRHYMMVPCDKEMSESCKNIYKKHGIEMHFKGGSTIKDLLVHPKDKDTILQKGGVIYRYKCVTYLNWTVKKNILGNQAELLQKGSENTWGPPHPSMTTKTPLDMTFLLKILALWAGRTKVLPDPSNKQY